MNTARKYQITKLFTAGLLAGITVTERTDVAWKVGQEVRKPVGGSPYKITAVAVL